MRLHEGLVDLQICRAAAQALHIDPPLLWVEVEGLQRSGLAGKFDRVNVLVTTIVPRARVAFRVFVGHWRAQGVEDSAGGDIFGGNEDDGLALTLDFIFLRQTSVRMRGHGLMDGGDRERGREYVP